MDLQELNKQIAEKEKQVEDLKSEALDSDDIEVVRAKKEEIKSINEEIEKLKEQLKESEKEEKSEEKEEVPGMEERSILKNDDFNIEVPEVTSEEVRAFEAYLQGEKRDISGGNIKTDSGFVVIPEEIVTDILKLKEVEFNLDQYVTVKKVSNGTGKYPVVRQSSVAALPEVEELQENPELAVKPFFELAYDIKTHRGYFRISREAIEDSKINVLGELKLWLARTIAATRNAAIIDVLKNGGPGEDGQTTKLVSETVTDVDGIKDVINLNIQPNYEHNVAIVSQTAFATLDKLKDSNGNYLMQADIKEATSKRLLGARVVVLPDEMLGADGANTIIVGNLKDAIVLFDRSQYQAQWTDYMHFGECLMVAVRQDARLLDKKAAVVLTLDVAVNPEA